jgi:hypothetical protein
MVDKKERSYAKESTKSKPSGIRFDLEQLEFIQKRESKLNTKQKVVDFLLNKYWWEQKIDAKPNHKGLPPEYDAPKIENPIHDESPMFSQPKINQYDAYYLEISETNSVEEIEAVVREIKKDNIPDWQKRKLEQLAVEKSKTFDF